MQKLNVLILAAGLGTRLRPLTNDIPKPLVPIVDASILELQMRKANLLGDITLHANAHYLSNQMVVEGKRLGFEKIWIESEILGTAGPLNRIYQEGFRGGLLVMNGDAYCQFNLKFFLENAKASGADIALLGVDYPKVNSFRVGLDGKLAGIIDRFGINQGEAATFSGISWYSDEALSRMKKMEFDIREFWKQEIEANRAPFVDLSQRDALWIDMGSPDGLKAACDARRNELGIDSWCPQKNFETSKSNICLIRSVVQKGVHLPSDVYLEDAVLFDGALVKVGEKVCKEIRGKGFTWKL